MTVIFPEAYEKAGIDWSLVDTSDVRIAQFFEQNGEVPAPEKILEGEELENYQRYLAFKRERLSRR